MIVVSLGKKMEKEKKREKESNLKTLQTVLSSYERECKTSKTFVHFTSSSFSWATGLMGGATRYGLHKSRWSLDGTKVLDVFCVSLLSSSNHLDLCSLDIGESTVMQNSSMHSKCTFRWLDKGSEKGSRDEWNHGTLEL